MKTHLIPLVTLIFGVVIGTQITTHTSQNSQKHDMPAPTETVMQKALDAHSHVERPIDPTLPIPSANITLYPDTKGGYNLHIALTNFTVTPKDAGAASKANEGHMHIYVNGTKVGRMYGEWIYLPADLFTKDSNQVDVTLNTNDHADWMHEGKHIGDSATVPPHAGEPMKMSQ